MHKCNMYAQVKDYSETTIPVLNTKHKSLNIVSPFVFYLDHRFLSFLRDSHYLAFHVNNSFAFLCGQEVYSSKHHVD